MKALSIKQPWAWLICKGFKDIENRSWKNFTLSFPERIYVHASLSRSEMTNEVKEWILKRLANDEQAYDFMMVYEHLAFGAVIGQVDIVSCTTKSNSPWFTGPYGFVLANPKLNDFILYERGKLGFFNLSLVNPKVTPGDPRNRYEGGFGSE